MSIKLFEEIKDQSLKEYASDSAYEKYTAIILDPDKNEFKTLSGLFHDKKEVYDKMRKRGLVCRKVLEARIYDWIIENAKTTMDAYLMLSTAFSKWRGNNMLSDYYVQLLNDLPKINREKRKGDPQSIGSNKGWYKESVLNEVYTNPERADEEYMDKINVKIYPYISYPTGKKIKTVNNKGENVIKDEFVDKAISEYKNGIPFKVLAFKTNNPNKKYDDPKFYRELFKMAAIDRIGQDYPEMSLPGASITYIIKDEDGNIDRFDKAKWKSNYNTKNRNKAVVPYDWIPKGSSQAFFEKMIDRLKDSLNNTDDEQEKESLTNAINYYEDKRKDIISTKLPRFTDDELEKVQELKKDLEYYKKLTIPDEINSLEEKKAWYKWRGSEIKNTEVELNRLREIGRQRAQKGYNSVKDKQRIEELIKNYNSTFVPSNPIHGGDIEVPMIIGMDRKTKAKKELMRKLNAAKYAKDNDLVVKLKQGLGIEDPVKLTKHQKKLANKKVNDLAKERDAVKLRNITNDFNKDQTDIIVNKMIQNSLSHGKNIDTKKVNDAKLKVLNDKIKELKNNNELSNDLPNEARNYYNKKENQSEYINKLQQAYKDLIKNSSMNDVEEAVQVNDGASWLYNTQPRGVKLYGTIEEEKTKDTLNQKFFNGNILKDDVRTALLDIAEKFKEDLDLPFEPVDVYFTGSCANYNYNEYSDIDLHLVYDFENVGEAAEILSNYLFSAKKVFNDKYDIKIKGYPVEVGAENQAEPLVSSGVYSLVQNKWVKEPNNANTEIQEPDAPFYQEVINDIEEAIQSNNSKIIGDEWKELAQLRKLSLAKEGEFGPGNTLFKKLRNEKYLERLKDAYYNTESDRLSLESLEEII